MRSALRPWTPRETRLAIDLLAGAAIVSVAIALAGLVWRIAGHADSGAVTVPSRDRVRTTVTDLTPATAWAPFGQAALGEATQPTSIQATLKGVVYARPVEFAVAWVAIGSEPQRAYRVGDTLAGATIADIRRDRLILSNSGRAEHLALPDPFGTPPPAAGTAPGMPAPPVAGAPAPAPVSAPAAPPGNTAGLIQRLGATQVPGGYAVGAGAPPGMRAGDVVQSVNGAPLTDQVAANAALSAAQQAGQAQVTILRDGRAMTVTIPLR